MGTTAATSSTGTNARVCPSWPGWPPGGGHPALAARPCQRPGADRSTVDATSSGSSAVRARSDAGPPPPSAAQSPPTLPLEPRGPRGSPGRWLGFGPMALGRRGRSAFMRPEVTRHGYQLTSIFRRDHVNAYNSLLGRVCLLTRGVLISVRRLPSRCATDSLVRQWGSPAYLGLIWTPDRRAASLSARARCAPTHAIAPPATGSARQL